jgi:type VI secretion system secreted protein VgrG
VQCALVVGPPDQEIHTDEHGRVRVQFPWDREGRRDQNGSCWVRVSQGWGGAGQGLLALPRVGQEVLVRFLGGDPEQPVIVGRAFTATTPVPHNLPDRKTRTAWRSDTGGGSSGFNEITFEDASGDELLRVQAQRDLRKLVGHDETLTVCGNRRESVAGSELDTTRKARTEVVRNNRIDFTDGDRTLVGEEQLRRLVRGDEIARVEGDRVVTVATDRHLVVEGTKRELVDSDSHVIVKGARHERVGAQSLQVGGGLEESVGSAALTAGDSVHLIAGTSVVVEAPDITLKGAGGFVRIDGGGVTIVGNLVLINEGGSPGSGSGVGTTRPQAPETAKIEPPPRPPPVDVD